MRRSSILGRGWLQGPLAGVLVAAVAGSLALAYVVAATGRLAVDTSWSRKELTSIRSLWIGSLGPVPADPSNKYADDERAAALGHALFFDAHFSGNGRIACSTCHRPARLFQDGRVRERGMGAGNRRTPSIVGAAYSPWQFWDGGRDSLWSQIQVPLESAEEMGSDRTWLAHVVDRRYRRQYEAIFGPLPSGLSRLPEHAGPVKDRAARRNWNAMSPSQQHAVSEVLANTGKAIEAYERKLLPGPARFDRYAAAVLSGHERQAGTIYTADEAQGLRLFVGAAGCVECHNGPLFTNHAFENIGVPAVPGLPPDPGRAAGAREVKRTEFNCAGPFSDAPPGGCLRLQTLATGPGLLGQFKTPSLRNVARIPPYMHAGQFPTLQRVVEHYSVAPPAPLGHSIILPLDFNPQQKEQLVAFLQTLDGPLATDPTWLEPPR